MALQTGVHKFTGRLDNVIGYRRNGKYFFRSMPQTVRQTSATRRSARYFGIASRKGKLIRQAFRPHLNMRYDGTLVNRLNKLFIQSGRNNFPDLKGFHFNRHTGMDKLFLVPPIFTTNGTLHIPAQELLPQGRNTHLEVRLIAVRIDFTTHRVLSSDASAAIIDLNPDIPFNGIALNVPVEGEGTLMVALECRACTAHKGILYPSGDRRYMAADVIHLIVPIEQVIENKITRIYLTQRSASRKPFKRSERISSNSSANESSSYVIANRIGSTLVSSAVIGSRTRDTQVSSAVIASPSGPCAEPGRSNLPTPQIE